MASGGSWGASNVKQFCGPIGSSMVHEGTLTLGGRPRGKLGDLTRSLPSKPFEIFFPAYSLGDPFIKSQLALRN